MDLKESARQGPVAKFFRVRFARGFLSAELASNLPVVENGL